MEILSDLLPSYDFKSHMTSQQPQTSTDQATLGSMPGQPDSSKIMEGISMNGMGRLQLISRLNQQYGAQWSQNDVAKALMSQFDNTMSQGEDLSSLSQLVDSGNRVNDYLAQNPLLAPGYSSMRMGGQ